MNMFQFDNSVSRNWPYMWYGFFGLEEKYGIKPFIIEEYQDFSCPIDIKNMIINYLKKSPIAVMGFHQKRQCKCGKWIYTSTYRSDGIWLWPDDLSHLVESHNICIPNKMLKQIIEVKGYPPKFLDVSWEFLPWPGNERSSQ